MSWSFRFCFIQLIALAAVSRASPTDNDECNCYLTNGSNSAYYSHHKFYDFRSLVKYAQVPSPIRNFSRKTGVTSDYFKSDTWDNTWSIQDWNNRGKGGVSLSGDATVYMANSPSNIYIQKNGDDDAASDTFLTMRTMRMPGFQSAAEFESVSTYHYVSVRMLARVTGGAGACMALFTYLEGEDLADVQEADIEILTRDPKTRIQYTNQPSFTDDGDDIPKATRNGTLPKGFGWDDWVVHRLDWTPKRSVWYVQGEEVASIEFQKPKDPAQIILNAWSDGGSWSGNMSLGDAAYMQIQWIDMVYNTTKDSEDKRSLDVDMLKRSNGRESSLFRRGDNDDGCRVVCSIDDVDKAGEAKVLSKSAASHLLVMEHWTKAVVVGCVILMAV
ncbi:hypothetical protein NXS19_011606 [Fusarium pseudograminearum]|uniref:GH16 domain-containing protein n=1 Tax=Fusarium pseudograminearum (strain CS3096) TaxID=1028729 RepID=K3UZ39_FUSPC|nr:hypothetical protein FPSE_01582 [Fusarium pseudograminearum CS3096]EKJ78121.1 hypothetical protein FPSE_01582 [Fusarium pseudograminearum CS3096]UZP43794.1 hypothetical protein NXS19_011606 [Fusarium pseudograminearum]